MKSFRNMSRTVCERVSQTGQFVAGNVVTARFVSMPDDAAEIRDTLMTTTGVTGAEIWRAVAVPGTPATAESKLRDGPDETIGAAMVFHVMRAQDALDTSDVLSGAFGDRAQIGAYQLLCELRNESLEK